ncbi:MAG TPA: hypothetical protein VK862_05630 [Afifellaceae bacterium]|nr:hypothetical protein [Afifellaceae bacterium]
MLRKMFNRLTATVVAGLVIVAPVATASAQLARCMDRASIVGSLDKRFHERQAGFGLINSESLLELFISEAGTWTIIVTDRRQRTCVLATGDSWVSVDPPAIESYAER